jgi:DNA-binding beta-propeller fold protein YncE
VTKYIGSISIKYFAFINTNATTVETTIAVGSRYDSSNGNIVVSSIGASTITEINGANNSAVGVLQLYPHWAAPRAIVCDSNDNKLFVAGSAAGNVSEISFDSLHDRTGIFCESIPP